MEHGRTHHIQSQDGYKWNNGNVAPQEQTRSSSSIFINLIANSLLGAYKQFNMCLTWLETCSYAPHTIETRLQTKRCEWCPSSAQSNWIVVFWWISIRDHPALCITLNRVNVLKETERMMLFECTILSNSSIWIHIHAYSLWRAYTLFDMSPWCSTTRSDVVHNTLHRKQVSYVS